MELRQSIRLVKWDERLAVSAATQARRGQWRRPARSVPENSLEKLAAAVSIAVDVDQPLLRRARRALVPEADPSIEVELWNGAMAKSADLTRFALRSELLAGLRARLGARAEDLVHAREILQDAHGSRDPVVQLEEHATYLALSGGSDAALQEALGRILSKLREPEHQWLRSWAAHSLSRLPQAALDTEAARVLSQLVPRGVNPSHVAPPTHRDWTHWIGEAPKTQGRERPVWVR